MTSPRLSVSTNVTADIVALERQLAQLAGNDSLSARTARRLLQAQLAKLKASGSAGITPPPAPAPTFSPRLSLDRVGVEDLKLHLG